MKVKITKACDKRWWYSSHLEEVFTVVKADIDVFWVREVSPPYCLNFIFKEDCIEVKEVKDEDGSQSNSTN